MTISVYVAEPQFNYAYGPGDDGPGNVVSVPRNHRVVFTSSILNASGSTVKLDIFPSLNTGPAQVLAISSMYIGPHDGNLANADFTSAPTQVTFNGGDPGFTVYSGAGITSDEINFTIDENLNYMITYFHNNSAGSSNGIQWNYSDSASEVWSKYTLTDESSYQNVTEAGYDLSFQNYQHIIKSIQVR